MWVGIFKYENAPWIIKLSYELRYKPKTKKYL